MIQMKKLLKLLEEIYFFPLLACILMSGCAGMLEPSISENSKRYVDNYYFHKIIRSTKQYYRSGPKYDNRAYEKILGHHMDRFIGIGMTNKQQRRFDQEVYPLFLDAIEKTEDVAACARLCNNFSNSSQSKLGENLWEKLLLASNDSKAFSKSLAKYKIIFGKEAAKSLEFKDLVKRAKEGHQSVNSWEQNRIFLNEYVSDFANFGMNLSQWETFREEVYPILTESINNLGNLNACTNFCLLFSDTPIRSQVENLWRRTLLDHYSSRDFYKNIRRYEEVFGKEASEQIHLKVTDMMITEAQSSPIYSPLLSYVNISSSEKVIRRVQKAFETKLSQKFLSSSNIDDLYSFLNLFTSSTLQLAARKRLIKLSFEKAKQ